VHLAEVLWSQAFTEDGAELGQVHDVRLQLTLHDDGSHDLTVEGIIVGVGALSARLGYAYGDVEGPWVLKRLLGWLGRKARYIEWELVSSFEDGRVVVTASRDDLPHPSDESAL
jgi:hypothetical protein